MIGKIKSFSKLFSKLEKAVFIKIDNFLNKLKTYDL